MPRARSASDTTMKPPLAPRRSGVVSGQVGLWIAFSPDAGRIGEVLPLAADGAVVVGRDVPGDGCVVDRWLSRAHFRVTPAPGGRPGRGPWIFEELGARNGSLINGHPSARCLLPLGSIIRAGATIFVLDVGLVEDDDAGIVGWSESSAELRLLARRAAAGRGPVHVTGPSGAGKEVLAAAIHAASSRHASPFVPLNMAAVVEDLAESQLFGHIKGAFSGATADKPGAFDAAARGTLLLDEVGETPLGLQAKLLRAVDAGEVQPVGAATPHAVDVRVVTATHRDLRAMVDAGDFREDLFWRLAHTIIDVPPLAVRKLDVAPLFDALLIRAGAGPLASLCGDDSQAPWHAADLVACLLCYDWPGNVRELRDEAARLVDTIAARQDAGLPGPIPPVEEAVSARVRVGGAPRGRAWSPRDPGTPETPETPAPAPATLPDDRLTAEQIEALLADPDGLAEAISASFDGNIKAFAKRAAILLGKRVGTVRRQVYRKLGDRVGELRRQG